MTKKIKTGLLKIISAALGGILTLLGMASSCLVSAYGCPSAKYTFKGKVTSSSTGEPIPGIKVSVNPSEVYDSFAQSILTDKNGDYEIIVNYGGIPEENIVYIRALDVDGELNGNFSDAQKPHTIKETDFSGGDGSWDEGSATTTIDIQMDPL